MNRRGWVYTAATFGLLLICSCFPLIVGVILLNWLEMYQPSPIRPMTAVETADAFMHALNLENYDQAFAMCAPELQEELVSSVELRTLIKNNRVEPGEWNWDRQHRDLEVNQVYLEGNVKFKSGRNGVVNLELEQQGEFWVIYYLNLQFTRNEN